MISRGKADARRLAHARVLLQADASEGDPDWTDTRIAEAVRISVSTIGRVRQRFVEEGLEAALRPRPSPRVYARKLHGEQEAKLVALACSGPPEGKKRWTLRLLAERMVELEIVSELSHETVRQTLKKECPQAALVQKSDCRRGQVAWGAVRQCAGTPACPAGSSGSASRSRPWPRSSGRAEPGRGGLDR